MSCSIFALMCHEKKLFKQIILTPKTCELTLENPVFDPQWDRICLLNLITHDEYVHIYVNRYI